MAMRFHFFKSNDFHDKVKGHVYWIPYKTEIAITRHAEPHICIKGNNPSFLVVLLSRNLSRFCRASVAQSVTQSVVLLSRNLSRFCRAFVAQCAIV